MTTTDTHIIGSLNVAYHGEMTREQIRLLNDENYIIFMAPEYQSGDYVLNRDLLEWIAEHNGERVIVESQKLDEIDWEDF
ncbi:MAG: hypothetical protein ABF709_05110 [Leuconostoc pseudomesenteroides]|uniref:hypothetical protein n=1 Tax=Leuconostoc pseudomesenteroides TaxID=33968 RepID=UPI001E34ABAD|nr:hypothetical protein [Leuconostoc pseudomesenteroides]MCC7668902.1 hypothetical protein [Leuconostoc pseudomesenteroides]